MGRRRKDCCATASAAATLADSAPRETVEPLCVRDSVKRHPGDELVTCCSNGENDVIEVEEAAGDSGCLAGGNDTTEEVGRYCSVLSQTAACCYSSEATATLDELEKPEETVEYDAVKKEPMRSVCSRLKTLHASGDDEATNGRRESGENCAVHNESQTSKCCSLKQCQTPSKPSECLLNDSKVAGGLKDLRATMKNNDKATGCCSTEVKIGMKLGGSCALKEKQKALGGYSLSSRGKTNSPSSRSCSSKSQPLSPPEQSSSFLNRLMLFRSNPGASQKTNRPVFVDSSWRKGATTELSGTLCLNISGMTCSGCCTRIEKFMKSHRGIIDVHVSLLTSRGIFQFDPELVTAKQIEQTVATLGFKPSVLSGNELVGVNLRFGHCESSPRAKELALQIPGVVAAKYVDELAVSAGASSEALLVEYNPDITGARKIIHQLSRKLGVSVQASSPPTPSVRAGEEEMRRFTRLLFWSCLLSLPVIFVEFVLPALCPSSDSNPADAGVWGSENRMSIRNAVELACATPVLFIVAHPIHKSAFLALRYGGRVTMDVLISLSACTAYAFSVFTVVAAALASSQRPEVVPDQVNPLTASPQEQVDTPVKVDTFFEVTVLLVTLILVGRSIETLVKARASNSMDALLRMQAKTAILLEEGNQKELYIDVVLVERGDLLKVLPGTRVPTDGVVVRGASSVDEFMITGEARKVPKEPEAIVIGGSINSQGVLTMRVTHTIHESMLARMVRLVGEAQASRGVRQSIADAVAAYFTTFIIILAGFMFMLWYSLAKHGHVDTQGWDPFPFALRFAITVLVISCPCAISLAVPTAVMVATTKGSQVGILFKSGRALEALEEVDAVVFDKTGTLTTAQLGVTSVFEAQDGVDQTQLWRCVAGAERDSEHSIGKALVAYAEAQLQDSQVDQAQEFEAVPGCGVHCTVHGIDVRLGSLTWLRQQTYDGCRTLRVPAEFVEANQRFQAQGCIVVFVVIDGKLLSAIALRDALRPEAKCVINQLKREGIQPWIVTGDQRGTAMNVALALGVPEGSVLAESLPHQKVDKVRLLQSLGLRVAFVGDGVNDAPALATADVGVALGAGTDVALDAADIVLVKDDLRDLLNARALSNATNRRIKHNFAWGFMYNLLMMPIACGALYAPFGVWIPPALAGLSELLSSVPVVLFSLLLNFWKPPFGDDWGLQQIHVAIDVSESTSLLHNQHLRALYI